MQKHSKNRPIPRRNKIRMTSIIIKAKTIQKPKHPNNIQDQVKNQPKTNQKSAKNLSKANQNQPKAHQKTPNTLQKTLFTKPSNPKKQSSLKTITLKRKKNSPQPSCSESVLPSPPAGRRPSRRKSPASASSGEPRWVMEDKEMLLLRCLKKKVILVILRVYS